MNKLIVFLALCLSSCGGDYQPPFVIQQPVVAFPAPPVMNGLVFIKRGYLAGCSGRLINITIHPVFGRIYNMAPLYCGSMIYPHGWTQEITVL